MCNRSHAPMRSQHMFYAFFSGRKTPQADGLLSTHGLYRFLFPFLHYTLSSFFPFFARPVPGAGRFKRRAAKKN